VRNITFEIEFDDEGNATIRLPEGKGQQRDAAAVDDLTLKLAELLGRVKERHVGDHHHHDHGHDHGHDHIHH
jgi:hypothetical protein